MKLKYLSKFIFIISSSILSLMAPYIVYASGDISSSGTEESLILDDSNDNNDECGDFFYVPKSNFQSEYEYQGYCEHMYTLGYMDETYNWIPEAENYINSRTDESYEDLYETAKKIVENRIEKGEMEPEENPYITYEQKQQIIKQKEEQGLGDGSKVKNDKNKKSQSDTTTEIPEELLKENSILDDEDDSKPKESMNEVEQEMRENQVEESSNFLGTIMIVIGAISIIGYGYYIYKKQTS